MSKIEALHFGSHIHREAEISACGRYRWWLRRSWTLRNNLFEHVNGNGIVCFVMLNPSTADGNQDDPTIRRCIGFAKSYGYDALSVRNLFPYRATNPKYLLRAEAVTGGERGDSELIAALSADLVVIAWGSGVPFHRDEWALRMFKTIAPAKPIYCLGRTNNGSPRHPLYVKGDTQPEIFMSG